MTAAKYQPSAAEVAAVGAVVESATDNTGAQPFRYRFSTDTETCLRQLVYDAWDADDGIVTNEEKALKYTLHAACGHAVGDHLEKGAKALGYETQKPLKFDTGAVVVVGNTDMVRQAHALDIKLLGEKQWAKVLERGPREKDIAQVNDYAVANDSPRWLLWYWRGICIFTEGETLEWRLFGGDASAEKSKERCGAYESVEAHRKFRTLPERVFGAHPEKWPCGWCRHLTRCEPQGEDRA